MGCGNCLKRQYRRFDSRLNLRELDPIEDFDVPSNRKQRQILGTAAFSIVTLVCIIWLRMHYITAVFVILLFIAVVAICQKGTKQSNIRWVRGRSPEPQALLIHKDAGEGAQARYSQP